VDPNVGLVPVDDPQWHGVVVPPDSPAEHTDVDVVFCMLARRIPFMLLPDLAWPGRIPMDLVSSASTTGPIGIVGGTAMEPSAEHPDAGFSASQQAC
jgi:hypothetical protein